MSSELLERSATEKTQLDTVMKAPTDHPSSASSKAQARVLSAINAHPGMDDDKGRSLLIQYLKALDLDAIRAAEATTGPWY